MYRFDCCTKCNHLYKFYDIQCCICNNVRFLENTENQPIEKRMQSFFVCADLNDIQQSYYSGKIQSISI